MMLAWFKDIISLGFYAGRCLQGKNKTDSSPVLLYHSVADINPKYDSCKLNLQIELFKRQLEALSLSDKQSLLLTFDDGFESFFDNVFSLILRYNFKTILFVSTDFIDGRMSFDRFFSGSVKLKPLSWKQLKQIADSGIEIGSHTKSHPLLCALDDQALRREIADSKKIIEDSIGKQVKYFAYPYGGKNSFNKHIQQIVQQAGYEKAYTNIMGFNTQDIDSYQLKRIRIYSNDNMFRFKMKIKGAYNWVDSLN